MIETDELTIYSIGGTIGTALYVQIGRGLLNGGPASLFIAFTLWCSVILAVTLCMAEMVTYLPISSPFIRFAGRYADEAFGFAAGWNFFIFEAILVPFEMTACNVVIHFWSDAVPTGAVIAIVMVSAVADQCSGVSQAHFHPCTGAIRCHQPDGSQVVWRD
jgi:amino acid transporter